MPSIGQDTVVVTPISMLRAVSSVGVQGQDVHAAFSKGIQADRGGRRRRRYELYSARVPGFGFQHPEPKIIEMTPEQNDIVLKGMWGVVNDGGTAGAIKMADWEIAGKTGTAQVRPIGKDWGNKDHAWFVSFAPAYKPEISVIALIENSGFGAANAAPAAKAMYEAYLAKRGTPAGDPQTVAKKSACSFE